MTATCEKTKQIKSLQGMMERLGAKDLTLAESLKLQPRLFELLKAIERSEDMGESSETSSREDD